MPDQPHPLDRPFLQEMSKVLASKLPDNYGYILVAMPFNGEGDNRLVYTSSIGREDAIKVLKGLLFRWGQEEDWMRHIK